MFWSVLISVMQTENWKKSRGGKAGEASFRFVSSLTVVYVRRLGALNWHFLKIFTEAHILYGIVSGVDLDLNFLVNYKHK